MQIATSLAHPRNRTARHIDGLANLFTAAICKVTKGRPGRRLQVARNPRGGRRTPHPRGTASASSATSAPMTRAARHQLALRTGLSIVVTLVLLAFTTPLAQAAASRAPRNVLLHAQAGVRTLASQASTSSSRSLAASASRALSGATASALWIDPSDSVAPAYGSQIFTDLTAALADLQSVHSSCAGSASREIVVGLRALAAATINRASGSKSPLLANAMPSARAR